MANRTKTLEKLCLHEIAKKDSKHGNNHHEHEGETTMLFADFAPRKVLHIMDKPPQNTFKTTGKSWGQKKI